MKKLLLTLAAVALSTTASWADVTTMVFDGENDMAGLTRQTTTNPADVVNEVTYSQDGVDFKLEVTSGTGKGFALVNAGGTNAGLYVSSSIDSQITLNVPNGHITGATIYMTGYALPSLDLNFNGKEISSETSGSLFYWNWSDAKGGETLTISWPTTFMARYIHSLEVSFTPDLGGKEPSGLSFSKTSAEGFVGESFSAPSLSNPNKLPITWTSSNTDVATVNDKGQVSIVGKGTTYIIVATEGNDQYAAGNARYNLTAIPVANSVTEMIELAPVKNDRVKVNFPMTAYFVYSPSVYAVDEEMTACYFTDSRNEDGLGTVFAKGDIVPANWIATNDGGVSFKGRPAEPKETGPVVYQEVTSVTKADANRVVILKDVTFAGNTPSATTSAKGTTPDGTVYNFQNPFNAPEEPAGTYNVTLVVKYELIGSTEYFYLAPISYFSEEGGGDEEKLPAFPESFVVNVDNDDVEVSQEADEYEYYIYLTGETAADTVTLTLEVPEGWDGYYCASSNGEIEGGEDTPTPLMRKHVRAADDEEEYDYAISIRELLAYYPQLQKGNSITLNIGDDAAYGIFFLYKGDEANAKAIMVNPALTKLESNPVFPESFEVSLDVEDLDVTQGEDQGVYTIRIEGKTEAEAVTVTVAVPEGWDGFIGYTDSESAPDIDPLRSVRSVAEDDEDAWAPLEALLAYGMKEGNEFEFPADGEEHGGMLYLYKGDMVYQLSQIALEFNVEKAESEAEPVFPESFEVSLDVEDLDVTQGEDQGVYTIRIEGKTEAEAVTVTVAVPEGWDGFIGYTDSEPAPDINPLRSVRSVAEDDEDAWAPLEALLAYGMKEGNEFEFPADGEEHGGMLYLYKGDMVYQLSQIALEFNVKNDDLTGVDTIEGLDSEVRYINLQGIEVKNPERGIYVKISNGKISKVTQK